jgi:membrane-associated phospholipid phosphatase
MAVLPAHWRVVTVGLSAIVPLARMYVGAHLPIGIVGGSFLGLAIGFSVRRSFQTVGKAAPRRSGPS